MKIVGAWVGWGFPAKWGKNGAIAKMPGVGIFSIWFLNFHIKLAIKVR